MSIPYPHIDDFIEANLINKFIRVTVASKPVTFYVMGYLCYFSAAANEYNYVFETYCVETNKREKRFSLYESEIVEFMENKKNYYYQIEIIG